MSVIYYDDIPVSMLKDKSIFEVGAGHGDNQLRSIHRDVFLSEKYLGIDRKLEKEPLLNIYQCDILDFWPLSTYDVILMMHVIEHIQIDEWYCLIAKLKSMLNVGGWLVIAAPYNEFGRRPYDIDHVVFDIDEQWLSVYLPEIQVFRSSMRYPKRKSVRGLVWWFRQFFFGGEKYVPLGLLRYSFIAFWKKENEEE